MKQILFIETPQDYRASLEYLRRNPGAQHNLLIINLNASHIFDYADFRVAVKTEADYLNPNTVAGINERALAIGRQWFLDPELRSLLEIEGLNAGLALENFFVRELIAVFKYARLAGAIARAEPGAQWTLIDAPPVSENVQSLLPSNEEKIFNRVVAACPGISGNPVRTLAGLVPARKPRIAWSSAAKKTARPVINLLQRICERSMLRSTGKAVALVGAPRLMFPLVEALRQKAFPLVYFQNAFAPRMALRLWRLGTRYRVSDNYATAQDHAYRENIRHACERRFSALMGVPRFAQWLEWDGQSMAVAVADRLRHLMVERLPDMLLGAQRFQRFFDSERISAVLIDEAVKEFGRPFILAANARGIPSVEIQHGIPDYYVHHRLVTTKLAAWGDYCKSRFVAESGLNPDAVAVTGSPTLDGLRRRDRDKDIAFVRRSFHVKTVHRIVTLAATPFHLGSRGGVIGEHLTRAEVEFALRKVLEAAASIERVHVIVKLHHTDPYLSYVRQFVRATGFAMPCSVVQAFDIYPLMHASDVFLSLGSTAMLEALVLGTPVVQLDFLERPDPYPYAAWGALRRVQQPESLGREMHQILSGRTAYTSATASGRQRVLDTLAHGADGNAGQRCAVLVQGLLARTSTAHFSRT